MRIRRLLMFFLLAATMLSAFASDRSFPPDVKRGKMSPADYPGIVIDGTLLRLSPGAQIRDQRNMIQMPGGLAAGEYLVNYTQDVRGQIHRIWMLTPSEAAVDLPAQ